MLDNIGITIGISLFVTFVCIVLTLYSMFAGIVISNSFSHWDIIFDDFKNMINTHKNFFIGSTILFYPIIFVICMLYLM